MQSHEQASLAVMRRRSRGIRALRIFVALVVCVCLMIGIAIGSLYFLLQGKTGEDSPLVARVEQSLQEMVGPDFNVDIETVDVSFSKFGRVILGTENIIISRITDNMAISKIGSLETNLDLWKTFSGETDFSFLSIKDIEFDASLMGPNNAFILPAHLDASLNGLGGWLARLSDRFAQSSFKGFEISNAIINGQILGRKKQDPIKVSRLLVESGNNGQLLLTGKVDTELSDIAITSEYGDGGNGWRNYGFSISGIHAGEWLSSPESEKDFFANDGIIKFKGDIPFNPEHQAFEPRVNLSSSQSTLRLGRKQIVPVKKIDLNFRLFLDRNQIELDPSYIQIGGLKAELIGGIKPVDQKQGYAGSILYDLIMNRGLSEATIEGEAVVPVGMKAAGIYDRDAKQLSMDEIIFTTEKGYMSGNAIVGFDGETPSLKGQGNTDGISVAALKQFWPFFIANGARKWVHSHVKEGWISKGRVSADIPSGILFRLYQGKRFTPEQLTIKTEVKEMAFRPFGEMPDIVDGIGQVNLNGMEISAAIDEGHVEGFSEKSVQIRSGTFIMNDFADPDRIGKTTLTLDGNAKSVAQIFDHKPLRLMNRMKVSAGQFSGNLHADVIAEFPVGRKVKYDEVKWNVLLDLQNGKSSKKLANRIIEKANVVIDANPTSASVTGVAHVDGVKARLNLVEPIGKSGKVKRKRLVTAKLTEKDRERLGIDLKPIVSGTLDVEIVEQGNKEFYKVDLSAAKVEFPWVGWSKSERIPAKGSFILTKDDGVFTLRDLNFNGNGFGAKGKLTVGKKGLISADIEGLKLNKGDDVNLKVRLKDNAYIINASGNSYDARGVINTLIYENNFQKSQGSRTVNLVANFRQVTGFGGRRVDNVLLLYESRDGRLHKLDLQGTDRSSKLYSLQASRSGSKTYFDIQSGNAGNALAFTNIYTKMRDGGLDAKLVQEDRGPYVGPVRVTDFMLVNEPRLSRIASSEGGRQIVRTRGEEPIKVNTSGEKVISFLLAQAIIEKGKGYMNLQDAVLRSRQVGMSMNGVLYDSNDRMNITGTYMPANAVNLALSNIPILSQLFSNGRDNALIGITYQLKGRRDNPELVINPLSVVAPGIFNKVFEFK